MAIPIIILFTIPIILGIVYVSPFDEPETPDPEIISEESDVSILYLVLVGIWTFILLRMLIRIKKGTFRITQKY
ncbi:MAG: hypothetical protein K0U66_10695 [Gammaproteobacteria bacterium]|nr:hypothetical protein [Gammaproteobacteria bacterium]